LSNCQKQLCKNMALLEIDSWRRCQRAAERNLVGGKQMPAPEYSSFMDQAVLVVVAPHFGCQTVTLLRPDIISVEGKVNNEMFLCSWNK